MVSDEEALTIVDKVDGPFGKFSVTRVETKPASEVIASPVVHFVKLLQDWLLSYLKIKMFLMTDF